MSGSSLGNTTFTGTGLIKGRKEVNVYLKGWITPIPPPVGGVLANPFKSGQIYQGDLGEMEYPSSETSVMGNIKILKVYKPAKTVAVDDTVIWFLDGRYQDYQREHLPEVGVNIMKSGAAATTTGTAATIIGVEKVLDNGVHYLKCTLSGAIGALSLTDLCIEADKSGVGAKSLVQKVNIMFAVDDKRLIPADADDLMEYITPSLNGLCWIERMSYMPTWVESLNSSKFAEWFKLDF